MLQEILIPLFDPEDPSHVRLAELAQEAEEKTREFQAATPPPKPISPKLIGSYRNKVREAIKGELAEIDGIVAEILKG